MDMARASKSSETSQCRRTSGDEGIVRHPGVRQGLRAAQTAAAESNLTTMIDRWASVLAVATSVVAWLRLGWRPEPTPGRNGDEPAENLTGDAGGERG